ncbi:hypothetical protein M8J75_001349 [Diaphorina citri]|nr:hypothetical protein M8J75_001349 [Diaphorina citri]
MAASDESLCHPTVTIDMVRWGMTGAASEVPALWDMDSAADYYECDCPGPPSNRPPEFRLPPPPRPPPDFLSDVIGGGGDCNELSFDDIETCDMKPVIDPEPSILPALPSLAIVGLFSLLLLTFILVAAALLCKHKKKMQNLLPCKSSPQNRCDVTHGNGVIYEDLTNIRPRPLPQPSIEMLDVKNYPHSQHTMLPHHPNDHHYVTNHYPPMLGGHQPVFICSRPTPTPLYCAHPTGQDLYNPVYEELSNGSAERGDSDSDEQERIRGVSSEEDFAEDELSGGEHGSTGQGAPSSLLGSTGNDLARDLGGVLDDQDASDRSKFLASRHKHLSLPQSRDKNRSRHHGGHARTSGSRTSGRSNRSTNTTSSSQCGGPASLDRRRNGGGSVGSDRTWRNAKPPEAYHEGLLVDALLQLYPNMGQPAPPSSQHRPPYVVPVPASRSCAPYQSVPVISTAYPSQRHPQDSSNGVSSFRPILSHVPPPPPVSSHPMKVPSQDSDSGYSNNTSGGGTQSTGTSARGTSNRSRTNHRLNSENLYS